MRGIDINHYAGVAPSLMHFLLKLICNKYTGNTLAHSVQPDEPILLSLLLFLTHRHDRHSLIKEVRLSFKSSNITGIEFAADEMECQQTLRCLDFQYENSFYYD